jgi:hypothetical protein
MSSRRARLEADTFSPVSDGVSGGQIAIGIAAFVALALAIVGTALASVAFTRTNKAVPPCVCDITNISSDFTTLNNTVAALVVNVTVLNDEASGLQTQIDDLFVGTHTGPINTTGTAGWTAITSWTFAAISYSVPAKTIVYSLVNVGAITLATGAANTAVFPAVVPSGFRPLVFNVQDNYVIATTTTGQSLLASLMIFANGDIQLSLMQPTNATVTIPTTLPAGFNGLHIPVDGADFSSQYFVQ